MSRMQSAGRFPKICPSAHLFCAGIITGASLDFPTIFFFPSLDFSAFSPPAALPPQLLRVNSRVAMGSTSLILQSTFSPAFFAINFSAAFELIIKRKGQCRWISPL